MHFEAPASETHERQLPREAAKSEAKQLYIRCRYMEGGGAGGAAAYMTLGFFQVMPRDVWD